MTRLLLIPLLLSCETKSGDNATGVNDTGGEGTTTIDTGTVLDETGMTEDVAWWRLSGQLVITKGLPDPKQSTLQITLLTETLKPICAELLPLSDLFEAKLPHPDIYAWWLISLGKGDGGCAGLELPSTPFHLGIGEMHPDILPGLQDDPDIADPSALNGAYASFDENKTLLVFGASGLSETWTAGGEPVSKSPIPDGSWRFEPVYTFEYVK